jgi:hypothetical protein
MMFLNFNHVNIKRKDCKSFAHYDNAKPREDILNFEFTKYASKI